MVIILDYSLVDLSKLIVLLVSTLVESVFRVKAGSGNLYVDISDTTEERLQFGMEMHMLNDLNYQKGVENDINNAVICGDLSVMVFGMIKAGEEISTSHNYNNQSTHLILNNELTENYTSRYLTDSFDSDSESNSVSSKASSSEYTT